MGPFVNEDDGICRISCCIGAVCCDFCVYIGYAVDMSMRTERNRTKEVNIVFRILSLFMYLCICIWLIVKAFIISLWRTCSFGTFSVQRDARYFCSVSSDSENILLFSKAACILVLS